MSAPYRDIPYLWEHLALPRDPFPWDHATAVRHVKFALDELGGIEGLCKDEIPIHYVMASNWVYARQSEVLSTNPAAYRLKNRIANRAKRDPNSWDAMVLVVAMSLHGDFIEAYRIVHRTIGGRPALPKGRKDKMQRNAFIVYWIEVLQDAGGMKLKDAYAVMAKVLQVDAEVIRKGRTAYLCMMEMLNPETEDLSRDREEWNRYVGIFR